MKPKVYFQPKGSGYCGQYAVAHLVGCTPKQALEAFGINKRGKSKNGTTTRDVQTALQKFGYHCDERMLLITRFTELPELCLLDIRWKRPGTKGHGKGHWVLYKSGTIICSGVGIYHSLNNYLKENEGVAVAYLPVTKIEDYASRQTI